MMASGVKSAGVDLDDLFDPDIVGDGPIAPGVKSGGVPLKYAALKYGTKRANVGIADAGGDASNLWAAKGTAKYLIAKPRYDGLIIPGTGAGTITTFIRLLPDGSWVGSDNSAGYWYGTAATAGIGASYEVMATVGSGGGSVSNPAATWVSLGSSRTVSLTSTATANRSITLQIRKTGEAVGSTGTVQLLNTLDG